MNKRRSRFELIIEVIELCVFPGLPKTRLSTCSNINSDKLSDILMELVTGELLEVETRPRSFAGNKRETDFYVRTSDGDELIRDIKGVKERLSIEGVHSQLESPLLRE